MSNLFWPALLTILGCLACGGGGVNPPPQDRGRLYVFPNPATLTPSSSLVFAAVPDVKNEAPNISSTTWTIDEPQGGSVQVLTQVGDQARYTAPPTAGTFHLRATSNFGTSWYVPQPGTLQVISPSSVGISLVPNALTLSKGYSGPSPHVVATVTPITNNLVDWSIVEPGFEGPGFIELQKNVIAPNDIQVLFSDSRIDALPGTRFHIKAQSVEAPEAFALVEVTVVR